MAKAEWNAVAAIAVLPLVPWRGSAWRIHKGRYSPLDATGARLFSGRFHRGLDRFPAAQVQPLRYLTCAPEIAIVEKIRHTSDVSALVDFRLTEIAISLTATLDCRDATALGLPAEALRHDTDWTLPQALGAAAFARGSEALLVASASALGDNLLVFPARLRPGSQLEVIGFREPRFYVDRGDLRPS